MTSNILRGLLHQLTTLRTSKPSLGEVERSLFLYRAAYFDGYLDALRDQGLITWDEWVRLLEIRANLGSRIGDPFPSCANAGPFMPASVRMERAKKPQAVEPAHEPVELPAADSCEQLPVQRVLVSPFHVLTCLFGKPAPRPNRALFPRLHPSWAPVLQRRQMVVQARQLRLPLGLTKVPCALLDGDRGPWHARSLCADSRALRTGVTAA